MTLRKALRDLVLYGPDGAPLCCYCPRAATRAYKGAADRRGGFAYVAVCGDHFRREAEEVPLGEVESLIATREVLES